MPPSDSPFPAYQFISLPDLSTLRRPPRSRELISVQIDAGCSEKVILVALARCLGAYCAATDVLLGWRPADSPNDTQTITAARVSWANANSYEDVLKGLILQDTEDSPSSTRRNLRLQLDAGLEPFLAVLTPDLDYKHPLVVSLGAKSEGDDYKRALYVKYSTLSFHASTAELFARQLCAVAAGINGNSAFAPRHVHFLPDEMLSLVPVRTDGSSYTHYPEARTIADFIPRHDPAVVALEYYPDLYEEDSAAFERAVQRMTYGELHERSNRFAAYLCAQGLKLEDRITVCMPRGVEFHVAMVGVFKAGGCYVPIDPELPGERQKFINEDSGARFALTAENIEEYMAASKSYSADDINNAQSNGLAYLLYTSGTTGTPKGCLLTHDGFAQAIHALSWFANQAGPNKRRWPQTGRYLAVASVAFDVHLAETFVGLSLGMTLVSAPRSQLLEDLPRWLHRLHVTHVGIVPSLIEATMHAVAESAELTADEKGRNTEGETMNMAYIASGGEKMSDPILETWADHPLVTLANFYGPSEVTIGCSARLMTSDTRKESIGRIFENCSAYVVDESLDLVIRGGVGELLVGGRLVGRGYHNRPDLTENAFINFSHGSHTERVYRTGDLVRLMPDDTLEIMGRKDTQIKLRGVRIESEGVSSVIRNAATGFPWLASKSVPDVSTILACHPQLKTDQLVSFVALDSSKSVAHRRSAKPRVLEGVPPGLMRTLKEACTRELASYMRPAHIVPLDFLPLNQNGKTDNKALGALFQAENLEVLARVGAQRHDGDEGGKEPSRALNETEAKIADLVARYTEVDSVQLRPSSNLFQHGFDSLKLVRLASELRSSHNAKSISVSSLIQHPTIEGIATLLVDIKTGRHEELRNSHANAFSRQWRHEVEETYGAEKVDRILPTFPVQDGVLYRSADLNTLYIQHVVLRIHDDVEIEKLKSAWAALMSQREILRTVFHFSSSLVQVVLKAEACELPWLEQMIQADNVPNFHYNFVEGDAVQFARTINENISTSPAFQLACYRAEGKGAIFLTLSIHHAMYDGISLPLLLQDVETLYFHENPRPSVSLTQVLDAVYNVDVDEATTFWKQMFNGFEWSKIPKRLASGETANVVEKTFDTQLSQWELDAAQIKVSLQAVLTAAFGVCLGEQMYGVRDVVFGVIRSGRSFADDEINDARAPLLTVLPTRVNAELGADLLQTVQRNIGAALAFEHVPLSRVQKWVQPGRTLFEVLFSVSIDDDKTMKLWDMLESKQPQADYILAVEVVLDKKTGQIRVDCAYTEPLGQHDISRILRGFESTAKSLVEGNPRVDRMPRSQSIKKTLEEDSDTEDVPNGPIDEEREEKIQSIVSQFLRVEKDEISSFSSLIALGLDSIRSVGLSRALRYDGIHITSLDMMRHPTIRQIAARSAQTQGSSKVSGEQKEGKKLLASKRARIAVYVDEKLVRIDQEDEVQLYPTTVLQAGMLSQTISSGGQLYVHAFPFKLVATIDVDRLRQAWRRAVQYFSILRTSFHFAETLGAWIQVVHSSCDLNWTEEDGCDGKTVLSMTEEYIKDLDLSSEYKFAVPPVYMRLHRRTGDASATPHTLVLVLHHALYDGISISRLSDVVHKFYRDEEPTPSPQFVDLLGYFEYQERHGTEYWIKQLHDFKRPVFPRKTDAAPESKSVSASAEISISAARMSEASKLFDVTVQCFGQASLAKILVKLYNRRDIVFGHVVSGRNVPHAEDVLGPMISTLPYRARISAKLKNLDFVRSIHRQNMAVQKWQHASLRSIQRKASLSSLWDAIFLFQPIVNDDSDDQTELWSFDDPEDEIAKIQYPLNIELHQHADLLVIKAACQSDFCNEKDLDAIVKDFSQAFWQIINEPSEYVLSHIPVDDEQRSEVNGVVHHVNGHRKPGASDSRVSKFIDILAASVDVTSDSIEPDTPLVSLGVDSITAIQISSKAREVGLKLHAADILRCQTPDDVVEILESKGDKASRPSSNDTRLASYKEESILDHLGSSKDLIQEVLPASAGMEWLIGMWQLSNRARFQHVFAFGLPNDIDEDKLRSSWSILVQKHPILRSTFVSTTGNDVHVVIFKKMPEERLWSRREVTLKHCARGAVEDIAKGLVSEPLSTDLPPCQAVFLRLLGSNFFIMRLHHFQYDAWSLRLLINDLRRLYMGDDTAYGRNVASFLDNCNFPSFKEEQMRYWSSYLPSPFEPSLLPKLARNRVSTRDRLVYIDRKAAYGVTNMRQRAQDLSLSLNVVFLACWAQVQAKHSNANSATFGLWHLGRSGVVDDIESLPLPCMNVLPIHVDAIDTPLLELANRIQTTLRQRSAIVEQSHLEDVNHWTGGNRGDRRIMMNVFVNIVATAELEDGASDDLFSPIDMPYFIPNIKDKETRPTAERLAICNLMEDAVLVDFVVVGENITMSIEYTADYLDGESSRTLVAEWTRLVEETLNSEH